MLPSIKRLLGTSIDSGRFELLEVIGKGGFGEVVLARDVEENKLVAIKCLSTKGLDARERTFLEREHQLHQRVSSHPYILTLHQIIRTTSHLFLVLDYVPGDLFDLIVKGRTIGRSSVVSKIFLQLLEAVSYSHQLGTSHRDLKPENILLDGDQVRLADWGLATEEERSYDFEVGSTQFMSPECRAGLYDHPESYSPAANDVFSLGVVLFGMIVGRVGWGEASTFDPHFRRFVVDPQSFLDDFPLSSEATSLFLRIFELDPEKRISLPELVEKAKEISRWSDREVEEEDEDASLVGSREGHSLKRHNSSPLTPTQDHFRSTPLPFSSKNLINMPLSPPATPSPTFATYPISLPSTLLPDFASPPTWLRQPNHLFLNVSSTSASSSNSSTINGSISDSGSSFFICDLTRSDSGRDLLDDYFTSSSAPSTPARTISNVETLSDRFSNVKLEDEGFPTDVDLLEEDQTFEFDREGWDEGGYWETVSLTE